MPALQLPPVFDALQVPLLFLTNILALAIGPRHRVLQLAFSLPACTLLAAQSLYRDYAGAWGIHYAINSAVMSALATYVDWVVLASPDREGWTKLGRRRGECGDDDVVVVVVVEKKAGEGDAGDSDFPAHDGAVVQSHTAVPTSKRPVAPQSLLARLWWAARLACTNRYTGWTAEVKNVPFEVPASYPRWRFILRKTLRAALFYLAKDALYAYTAASPHGSWTDIAAAKPARSFAAYPFWHRVWFTWTHVALTYVSLELYNSSVGVASVALHLAPPSECPSAFGDLRGLYSVRRAWSVVWHQQCRRICSAPATRLVRDALRLRKGSFASKYVQLFVAFGISGLVHGGASMLCHASLADDRAVRVFLAQAALILVEDHVVALAKQLGFRDALVWRLVGFVWTVLAIGASMESWVGALLGHGMWVHERERDWFGIGPGV